MTATAASSPWVTAHARLDRMPWRFGRPVQVDGHQAVQWALRRNCSMAPRQLLTMYLALCAVSLTIAGAFGAIGATPVLAFAGLEILVVGAALLVYVRHAADRELLTLSGDALQVEHHFGMARHCTEFRAAWVRIEPLHGDGSMLELTGEGRKVRIGRYMRPELRQALAQELRHALRALPAARG